MDEQEDRGKRGAAAAPSARERVQQQTRTATTRNGRLGAIPYIHSEPTTGAHRYVLNVATYDYFGAYDGVNPFLKIPNVNVLSVCLARDPRDGGRDHILGITQPGHAHTGGVPELVKFPYDELVHL